MYMCMRKWSKARGIRHPGAGITDGVKILNVGLGTELWSSALTVLVLNQGAISVAKQNTFLFVVSNFASNQKTES